MTDFLNELNASQKDAVTTTKGPVMVIAGAGSGKTRVLTYRVAWLLHQGVSPFRILALTFTNKAAREMRDRIARLVDPSKAKSLWMGTFHSIFARILRSEASLLDYPGNFTIYDTDDSKRIIRQIIKELDLDDKTYNPGFVLGRISQAKNSLISAAEYNADNEILAQDSSMRKPRLGEIYTRYQNRLRNSSAMDFDDLLFNTNVLLRDFPDVLYKYQQRFEYILVDEYQDTNYAQYLIVKKLAANNENICVVGDDAQSIYAFRGANIQNILNFKKDYPDYRLFKLEQNYRSTKHIVNAANSIITNNKEQIEKTIWTSNAEGEKIRIIRTSSEGEEAQWLASEIQRRHLGAHVPYPHFAILYRTNAQSRALEEALRRQNIPYRIYGGVSFYQRKEVKDVLAYFRLAINPNDEDALLRVINFPARGIGQTTLNKLISISHESGVNLWHAITQMPLAKSGIAAATAGKLEAFAGMIKAFSALLYKKNAFDLAETIVTQTGIRRHYLEEGTPESLVRHENIEELLSGIRDFTSREPDIPNESDTADMRTLDEFMQDIVLLTDSDFEPGQQKNDQSSDSRVSLMTVHAAKGLEFPFVFIAGAEENLFPSQMSVNSRQELEEERRLFYVAITRAMQVATITYAETRFRYGNFLFCEPSRFIDELDPAFIEYPEAMPQKNKITQAGKPRFSGLTGTANTVKPTGLKPGFSPLSASKPPPAAAGGEFSILPPEKLQVGARVEHERFGMGSVSVIEGTGQNAKATVVFEKFGTRQLLLRYARLKILPS